MGLFKKNKTILEDIAVEKKKITKYYIHLVSTEYYGHADFKLISIDKEAMQGLYNEIKANIGRDYIIDTIVDSDNGNVNEYGAINLKFYAYVSFGKREITED